MVGVHRFFEMKNVNFSGMLRAVSGDEAKEVAGKVRTLGRKCRFRLGKIKIFHNLEVFCKFCRSTHP